MSWPTPDAAGLDRFVAAQDGIHDQALTEVRSGRKVSHWMWFVYPQLRGLGRSGVSRFYGLASLDEARAYLGHPVLGPRLREAAAAALAAPRGRIVEEVFGGIDAMKLRSSMTLFARAAPGEPVFRDVLTRYFDGQEDELTLALLGGAGGPSPGVRG